MDPDANLKEQLELAGRMVDRYRHSPHVAQPISQSDAIRLAELVLALDGWIRKGGFLPAPWKPVIDCSQHNCCECWYALMAPTMEPCCFCTHASNVETCRYSATAPP